MPYTQKKILVVDDEDSIILIMEYFCRALGLLASFAPSGEAGLELLREQKFDYILSDMNMPEMQGDKFIEKCLMMPNGRAATCFLMTADQKILENSSRFKHLVNGVLIKPFNLGDLKEFLLKYGIEVTMEVQ